VGEAGRRAAGRARRPPCPAVINGPPISGTSGKILIMGGKLSFYYTDIKVVLLVDSEIVLQYQLNTYKARVVINKTLSTQTTYQQGLIFGKLGKGMRSCKCNSTSNVLVCKAQRAAEIKQYREIKAAEVKQYKEIKECGLML